MAVTKSLVATMVLAALLIVTSTKFDGTEAVAIGMFSCFLLAMFIPDEGRLRRLVHLPPWLPRASLFAALAVLLLAILIGVGPLSDGLRVDVWRLAQQRAISAWVAAQSTASPVASRVE